MDFFEIVKLAFNSLRRNKLRSFLTMLGIIIGVFSVILLVSIGSGLKLFINEQFENLGTNLVYVMPGNLLDEKGNFSAVGQGPPNLAGSKLTIGHIRELSRLGKPIEEITGVIEMPISISSTRGKTTVTRINGVTANHLIVRNIYPVKGRTLNLSDIERNRKVTVLGFNVSEKIFPHENPVGKYVRMGAFLYRIIGVNEKKGGSFGFSIDDETYIPITTAQKVLNIDNVQVILAKVDKKENIPQAIELLKKSLSKKLDKEEFSVFDQKDLVKTIDSILSFITTALGAIAAISLLVGGIGIMNIMLVSVTERTHEIGLRKAIGARPKDIAIQFLIEAVFLSIVGGVVGILLAAGASIIISQFFQTSLTLWSVLLAFIISSLVGIIFGVAPAIRASRLNPIDALRYE